jgi:hypothetical protein
VKAVLPLSKSYFTSLLQDSTTTTQMKKWLFRIFLLLLLVALGLFIWLWRNGRDRFPGYKADLNIKASAPAQLKVGFAALSIAPQIEDTWVDVNGDAQFKEKDGDTWTDGNGNGRFDGYYLAGFQNARPAQGVHDPIWARAMVIDDGKSRVAIMSLDIIGFGNDDVIRVRKILKPAAGITYAMIGSTHVHEAPDMLGIWGPGDYKSGLNPAYSTMVIEKAAQAIEQAVASLRPAHLVFAQDLEGARHLITDTRLPLVYDHGLKLVKAIDAETKRTLGTLVAWGNHPETTWDRNLQITSDFPHYLREGLEKGIRVNDSLKVEGLGGTVVYVTGAVGGLMTTPPDLAVRDTFTGKVYTEPSFEKAKAEGEQLALLGILALRRSTDTLKTGSLGIRAKTFNIPLDNKLYRLGVALNIFNRGYTGGFGKMRTEVALLTLGPASFLCVPGEIYPEIVYGGIENPAEADFKMPEHEYPPLMQVMPGKYQFIFGLMNDEIGYIIPKSEWDMEAPYLYGAKEQLYGEINSCGPETAPLVYRELVRLCKD